MASRAQPTRPPAWRATVKAGVARSGAMLTAAMLALAAILLVLALASYRGSDPSLSTAAGHDGIGNWLGLVGAWTSDLMLSVLGPAVTLMLALPLTLAGLLWRGASIGGWQRRSLVALIAVALIAVALALLRPTAVAGLPAGLGGIVGLGGEALLGALIALLPGETSPTIARYVAAALLGIGGFVIWARMIGLTLRMPQFDGAAVPRLTAPSPKRREPSPPRPEIAPSPETRTRPVIADRAAAPAPIRKARQESLALRDKYVLPDLKLLTPAPPPTGQQLDKAALERNARLLETVLDDFHVKGTITEVRPGPVVTMYELQPAAGIKASRVIQLAEDIARNMSALSARVATIPGRSVIGIELPNAHRESVFLHEMIASQAFEDGAGALPIVLGKNIAGDPVIADLAPMPHLLIAGTTGSGKSVGLNSMICSLLYRLTPDECRMIMIDPKLLELRPYEDIPHLLAPVVTEPAKAIRALKWAVEEMEDRYRKMASIGVRSLAGYNDKVRGAKGKGQKLSRRVQVGYDAETGLPKYEEEALDLEVMPQIVVVVDELADLMMTAGKEVEFLIQRLAQKARAAGIHLIMATQRPSVDVITGVIKANLPTRISFHVTSKIDSRTILGEQGAEQLLGKGDMLYMMGGRQIVRVHGPFVSDDEVIAIADHWRSQGVPDYIQAVTEEPEDGGFALDGAPSGDDSPEDQEYRKAMQIVAESQKASVSWLQRQLRIGYNRAARHIERMEKDGHVGRPDHVGRREVLMDTEGHAI
ncbi:MAG: DNA translocase FtsK 4TM domain-containing protein [Sphingomonas sp.]|jgi:S-DNA-T family DNA segregation ATPase FtsK/SpoIIIE